MTVPVIEAEPPVAAPKGVSVIFLLLVAAFAISGAVLAAGEGSGVLVFAFVLIGWVVSLCLHEWGHAATAWSGGDRSVEERGYLTLNPLNYTNPFLSILMPIVFLAMGGIGFPGGAVYVRTDALRGPFWRMAVSAAGPTMNLVFLVGIGGMLLLVNDGQAAFVSALAFLGFLQATALLLNLLPVPGLDGFGILQGVLPANARAALAPISRIAVLAFFAVIIAAPQLLTPLWNAALDLCDAVGIRGPSIGAGYQLFRFWEAM